MGMPITVEVVGAADDAILDAVFAYFEASTGASAPTRPTARSRRSTAARLAEPTTATRCARCWRLPNGPSARPAASSTSARPDGTLDPSGIVKGWAIRNAAAIVARQRRARFLHRRRRRHPVVGQERGGQGMERRHPQPVQRGRDHQGRLSARARRRDLRHLCPRPAHLQPACARPPDRRHRQPDGDRPGRARGRPLRHRRLRHGQGRHLFHRRDAGPRGLRRRAERPRHADQRLRSLLRAMTKIVDQLLDHITMYRLVLYYLVALLPRRSCSASSGSCRTIRRRSPSRPRSSSSVCWITNRVFARVFDVPANSESIYITALILVAHPRSGDRRRREGRRRAGLRLGLGDGVEVHLRRRPEAPVQPGRLRRRALRRSCSTTRRPGGSAATCRCCRSCWSAAC